MPALTSRLRDSVASLMRRVAEEEVMPRFRRLSDHEIAEKSPGEVVTIADRKAEARLYDGLDALGLEARIVGEEAAARDPSLLDRIGEGLACLVDPLDGTANFAAGREPFGMMVALVEDGEVLAGWILDPVRGALFHAERGKGAFRNCKPVHVAQPTRRPPRAALGTHFLPEKERTNVHDRARRVFEVVPVPRCAAASYPRLAIGQDDVALFQRTLPWDHAAGTLFLGEAGGVATHWNGEPYRVGGNGIGVLAAASEEHWRIAADALLTPEAGIADLAPLPLPAVSGDFVF